MMMLAKQCAGRMIIGPTYGGSTINFAPSFTRTRKELNGG